jgi:hypothetical protein
LLGFTLNLEPDSLIVAALAIGFAVSFSALTKQLGAFHFGILF